MVLRNPTAWSLGSMRGRVIVPPNALPNANIPSDSFETYSDAAALNGLNDGTNGTHLFNISWVAAYVDKLRPLGVQSYDSAETYADAAALNGLNGGVFAGVYVDRFRPLGLVASDNAEGYSDAAALNALNGGTAYNAFTGWQGAFVNHNN